MSGRRRDAPKDLRALATEVAAAFERSEARVRHDPHRRWYEQVVATPRYDAWVIGWAPGQAIPAHDHGVSAGALAVTDGELVETRWPAASGRPVSRAITAGDRPHAVAADRRHALANLGHRSATSVHVYSPPLASVRWVEGPDDEPTGGRAPRSRSHERSTETVLGEARARLRRLGPAEAWHAVGAGALVVDIRPEASRRAEGEIPGAVAVERTVLEWRLDPASPDRLAAITGYGHHVILVCNEGYSSSLAAAALQDIGLARATDLVGGFRAWKEAGLPVEPPGGSRT
jgi:rhodanese-related sulfurtransferase